MATERIPFWQRHLKWLGVGVLLLVCVLVVLLFAASPGVAAMVRDAGRFHPVFIGLRLGLYVALVANWSRIARRVNPDVREDTVNATRRSLIVLFTLFEGLSSLPYLSRWI
jgi:predicted Kef-type K+ transport protein